MELHWQKQQARGAEWHVGPLSSAPGSLSLTQGLLLVSFRLKSVQHPERSPPWYPCFKPSCDILLSSESESRISSSALVPQTGLIPHSHSSPLPASNPFWLTHSPPSQSGCPSRLFEPPPLGNCPPSDRYLAFFCQPLEIPPPPSLFGLIRRDYCSC